MNKTLMTGIASLFGVLLGYLFAGILGALLGGVVGNFFGRGLAANLKQLTPQEREEIEDIFFRTLFSAFGQLAKADGRVSEEEVRLTEQIMTEMGLTPEHRRIAIELFKAGAEDDFNMEALLDDFRRICQPFPQLKRTLISYLVGIALSDGSLHEDEERLLKQFARHLGIAAMAIDAMIRMIEAQYRFGHQQNRAEGQPTTEESLAMAYQAIGVEPSVSDAALKKAYRRLMSENHPDKLMGQGVPQDMVQLATERSQEVQSAYELIRRHRKKQET